MTHSSTDTVIVRKASVWFVCLPARDGERAMWVNLALVTTVTLINEFSVRVDFLEGDYMDLSGQRAQVLLEELTKISSGAMRLLEIIKGEVDNV